VESTTFNGQNTKSRVPVALGPPLSLLSSCFLSEQP